MNVYVPRLLDSSANDASSEGLITYTIARREQWRPTSQAGWQSQGGTLRTCALLAFPLVLGT